MSSNNLDLFMKLKFWFNEDVMLPIPRVALYPVKLYTGPIIICFMLDGDSEKYVRFDVINFRPNTSDDMVFLINDEYNIKK